MSRYLLLDSGPLGIVTQPRISPEVVAMNRWLIDCLSGGDAVLVPAIIYYEIRRELLRARKATGLAHLDAFVQIDSNRYLALSDEALRLAAELWAQARQQGRPTSSALDLDIGCHPCRPGARSRRRSGGHRRHHQPPPSPPVCGRTVLE